MVNIQCTLMVGTWYPQACTFLHLKHRLHSHLEKSLMELTSISKTEQKDLMITIHVLEMNVNYFMYIIGYNFLFLCTIVLQQQVVMILILSLRDVKLL